MADVPDLSHSSLPFCNVMTPMTLFLEEQQDFGESLINFFVL